jgi:hypothetical protein
MIAGVHPVGRDSLPLVRVAMMHWPPPKRVTRLDHDVHARVAERRPMR